MSFGFKVWNASGELMVDSGLATAQISGEFQDTGLLYQTGLPYYYFEPSNSSAFQFLDLREGDVGSFGFFRRPLSKVQTRTVREIRLPEFISSSGTYGLNSYTPSGAVTFRASDTTIHVNNYQYERGNGIMGDVADQSNWVCVLNASTGNGTYNPSTGQTPFHYPFVSKTATGMRFETDVRQRSGVFFASDAQMLIITAN